MSERTKPIDEWDRRARQYIARRRIEIAGERLREATEYATASCRKLAEALQDADRKLPGRRPL